MFHIKNDKRSKKSAKLVVDTFDHYLEDGKFEDLTITELCELSTIGRATFYRLFDNLEDIIAYKIELLAEDFLMICKKSKASNKNLREVLLQIWMNNVSLLQLIFSLKRMDIILDCHIRHMDDVNKILASSNSLVQMTEENVIMTTFCLVGALNIWFAHDCQDSPSELLKILGLSLNKVSQLLV